MNEWISNQFYYNISAYHYFLLSLLSLKNVGWENCSTALCTSTRIRVQISITHVKFQFSICLKFQQRKSERQLPGTHWQTTWPMMSSGFSKRCCVEKLNRRSNWEKHHHLNLWSPHIPELQAHKCIKCPLIYKKNVNNGEDTIESLQIR